MIRKYFLSNGFNFLLLVTFITLNLVLTSAVASISHRRREATDDDLGNITGLVHISSEPAERMRDIGLSAGMPIRSARFSLQDQAGDAPDLPQPTKISLSTTATVSFQRESQQKCVPTFRNIQSQLTSVTLLRISPQLLLATDSVAPIIFSIDSTISSLSVEVNGSDPLNTLIWDPKGTMINKRVKRSAEYVQAGEDRGHSFTPNLVKLSRKLINSTDGLSKCNSTNLPNLNPQSQQSYQGETEKHSLHFKRLQISKSEGRDQVKQRSWNSWRKLKVRLRHSSLQEVIRAKSTHSPPLKYLPNFQKIGNLSNHELAERHHKHSTHNLSNHHHPVPAPADKGKQHYQNTEDDGPHFPKIITKTYDFIEAKSIKHIRWPMLGPSRQKPNKLKKNSHQYVSEKRTSFNQSAHELMSYHSTSSPKLTNRKKRKGYNPQRNETEFWKVNNVNIGRQSNHHNIYKNKIQKRDRRSSSLMSLVMSEGSAVWEIDQPDSGPWAITLGGSEPVEIVVTALSSLDFRYEFLDIRTMAAMTSQPVAYDTTLARLTLTSLVCVSNVTLLNLYNDAGETVSVVESDNLGISMKDMTPEGKTAILFWLKMPNVPFYMSVTGYDVMGEKFQRLSSERVVPRMFALSFINFRTEPLVPGNDYKFGVRLRNRGRSDTFSLTGSWDKTDYFAARIIPNTLKVDQDQISHVTVVVTIHPSIYFVMRGALIITATRMSDSSTDSLRETVTAEPATYRQDYESPVCTTISSSGGCRPDRECQAQRWTMSVGVTDSLTGVRSAVFKDPLPGSYNNVQFSYSLTNRTARADYGSTCCIMEATLVAYDYANNPSYCKLLAPILASATIGAPSSSLSISRTDKAASNTTSSSSSHFNGNNMTNKMSTSSPELLPKTSMTKVNNQNTRDLDIVSTPSDISHNILTNGSSYFPTSPSSREETSRAVDSITMNSLYTKAGNITITGNNRTPIHNTPLQQTRFDYTISNTLRLAAIICGSIAGTAGLAIAAICVTYKCVFMRRQRLRRRRSSGSDVTMGSSLESRSETSSASNSLRMSRVDERVARYFNGAGKFDVPEGGREGNGNTKRGGMTGGGPKPRPSLCIIPKDRYNDTDVEDGHAADDKNEGWTSHNSGEVEDVIFRCVVVKVSDKDCGKRENSLTEGAAEEVKKVSYSPMLRSGGKTYTNMLLVQRQMEEMDKQRMSLSYASCEGHVTQEHQTQNTFQKFNRGYEITQNNPELVTRRVYSGRHEVSYEDIPPGSPRLEGGYKNSGGEHEKGLRETTVPVGGWQDDALTRAPISTWRLTTEQTRDMEQNVVQACTVSTVDKSARNMDQVIGENAQRKSFPKATRRDVSTHRDGQNMNSANTINNTTSVSQNQTLEDNARHDSSTTPRQEAGLHTSKWTDIPHIQYYKFSSDSEECRQQHIQRNLNEEGKFEATSEYKSNIARKKRTNNRYQTRKVRVQNSPTHVTAPGPSSFVLGDYQGGGLINGESFSKSNRPDVSRNEAHEDLVVVQSNEDYRKKACDLQAADYVAANYMRSSRYRPRQECQCQELDMSTKLSHTPNPPPHSKSERLDPRFVHQLPGSDIITDANQIELRQNIEHIRRKLLRFQRRIDQEIEAEVDRSRDHSPSASSNHSNHGDD